MNKYDYITATTLEEKVRLEKLIKYMENKPKIRTYDDPRLMNLKRAAYSNNVVKGLKETVRLIKAGRAEQVFVADNELGEKYTSIIKIARKTIG